MNWGRCLVATIALEMTACGPGSGADAPMPAHVRVSLTDVFVGPVKSNGMPWDGPGTGITPEQAGALATALGAADPWSAVASFMMEPAIQGLEAPEVTGRATLLVDGQVSHVLRFAGQRDSTHPQLSPKPDWERVAVADSTKIEVVLTDADLVNDDPIGTFIINADAIREAVRRREVYQLNVAEQTVKTVLFIGVEASGD